MHFHMGVTTHHWKLMFIKNIAVIVIISLKKTFEKYLSTNFIFYQSYRCRHSTWLKKKFSFRAFSTVRLVLLIRFGWLLWNSLIYSSQSTLLAASTISLELLYLRWKNILKYIAIQYPKMLYGDSHPKKYFCRSKNETKHLPHVFAKR